MSRLRLLGLPAAALVLVGGTLAVQLANGGGSYEPLHPTDACVARPVGSPPKDIDGLTERLVLLGLDQAACRLHVSREALTLELAEPSARTPASIRALHLGLLAAVRRMQAAGALPPASTLVNEALDSMDVNVLLKAAIRAIPDSAIDAALKTDDVLTRTVDDLDLRRLLANLGNQDGLQEQIRTAVTKAVEDSLTDRLKSLL